MIEKATNIALALCLVFPIFTGTAHASLIDNGGFESGDFTDWIVSTNGSTGCDTDWNVGISGSATGCLVVGNPVEGNYAAYNSLKADGPQTFSLSQQFLVPTDVSAAEISWADTAAWSVSGSARTFTVDLLGIANIFTRPYNATGSQDWTTRSFDLTTILQDHEGEILTLAFTMNIPQDLTGEGGFGLDAITLNAVVPVPAAAWLFGTALIAFIGFSRRRAVS
jgi:hypothetical protein